MPKTSNFRLPKILSDIESLKVFSGRRRAISTTENLLQRNITNVSGPSDADSEPVNLFRIRARSLPTPTKINNWQIDIYDLPIAVAGGYWHNKLSGTKPVLKETDLRPKHATTMGFKIKKDKNNVLYSHIFPNNFGSRPGIVSPGDKNIYSPSFPSNKKQPRAHSEIAALQMLTGLADPREDLMNAKTAFTEAYKKRNKPDLPKYVSLFDLKFTNDKGEKIGIEDFLPDGFKKSILYKNLHLQQEKTSDPLGVKMYMQNSRWFPCDSTYDRAKGIIKKGSGEYCDDYLKGTIVALNDIYQGKVKFKLKTLNYGDNVSYCEPKNLNNRVYNARYPYATFKRYGDSTYESKATKIEKWEFLREWWSNLKYPK